MNIVINDYDGRDSYYEERHGSYIIWLGTNGNKTTNKMHELAHINMGTGKVIPKLYTGYAQLGEFRSFN